jgi:hypothetical protein
MQTSRSLPPPTYVAPYLEQRFTGFGKLPDALVSAARSLISTAREAANAARAFAYDLLSAPCDESDIQGWYCKIPLLGGVICKSECERYEKAAGELNYVADGLDKNASKLESIIAGEGGVSGLGVEPITITVSTAGAVAIVSIAVAIMYFANRGKAAADSISGTRIAEIRSKNFNRLLDLFEKGKINAEQLKSIATSTGQASGYPLLEEIKGIVAAGAIAIFAMMFLWILISILRPSK